MTAPVSARQPAVPGDMWVLPGLGLCSLGEPVQRDDGPAIQVRPVAAYSRRTTIPLDADGTLEILRPALSEAEASAVLAELGQRVPVDSRPAAEREFHRLRAHGRCDPVLMARELRLAWFSPYEIPFTEARTLDLLEERLLSELGHVLGEDFETLRRQVHAGKPAFAHDASPRPEEPDPPAPDGPELAGCTLLGGFKAFDTLVLGGPRHVLPAHDDVDNRHLPARRGRWYVYAGPVEGSLILLHADAVADARVDEAGQLVEAPPTAGTLAITEDRLAVVNRSLRANGACEDELLYRPGQHFPLDMAAVVPCGTAGPRSLHASESAIVIRRP